MILQFQYDISKLFVRNPMILWHKKRRKTINNLLISQHLTTFKVNHTCTNYNNMVCLNKRKHKRSRLCVILNSLLFKNDEIIFDNE